MVVNGRLYNETKHRSLSVLKPAYLVLFCCFITVLFWGGCQRRTDDRRYIKVSRQINLPLNNPATAQVILENRGKETARFLLDLNHSFGLSDEQIAEAVKAMPEVYPKEPLERKAWRYVCEKVKFSKALTNQSWPHKPALMINSVGNGLCDDLSATLYLIWKKLGMQTRVWTLGGHVVPEVFTGGKWHVYDPSHRIYYLNKENEVAGMEELSANPELITSRAGGVPFYSGNAIAYAFAHSKKIADIYASRSNNQVSEWYGAKEQVKGNLCYLPAGAKMIFPAVYDPFESPLCNSFSVDYAFLQVDLAAEQNVALQMPLVLYAITGNGIVEMEGHRYKIGSAELNNRLSDFSVFRQQLIFKNVAQAKVYYLVNRRALAFGANNTLSLQGYMTDELMASIQPTYNYTGNNYSNKLDSIISEKMIAFDKDNSRYAERVALLFSASNATDLTGRIEYLLSLENSNGQVHSDRAKVLNDKLLALINQAPNTAKRSQIYKAMCDPYVFIAFITLLEYCDVHELEKMMFNNLK